MSLQRISKLTLNFECRHPDWSNHLSQGSSTIKRPDWQLRKNKQPTHARWPEVEHSTRRVTRARSFASAKVRRKVEKQRKQKRGGAQVLSLEFRLSTCAASLLQTKSPATSRIDRYAFGKSGSLAEPILPPDRQREGHVPARARTLRQRLRQCTVQLTQTHISSFQRTAP